LFGVVQLDAGREKVLFQMVEIGAVSKSDGPASGGGQSRTAVEKGRIAPAVLPVTGGVSDLTVYG